MSDVIGDVSVAEVFSYSSGGSFPMMMMLRRFPQDLRTLTRKYFYFILFIIIRGGWLGFCGWFMHVALYGCLLFYHKNFYYTPDCYLEQSPAIIWALRITAKIWKSTKSRGKRKSKKYCTRRADWNYSKVVFVHHKVLFLPNPPSTSRSQTREKAGDYYFSVLNWILLI